MCKLKIDDDGNNNDITILEKCRLRFFFTYSTSPNDGMLFNTTNGNGLKA